MNNNEIIPILRNDLIRITKKENFKNLLEITFKNNLYYNNETFINSLSTTLNSLFGIDSLILLEYMSSDYILKKEELDLPNDQVLEIINNLKDIYGIFIAKSINRTKNAFGIQSISSNIGNGMSHNSLQIIRNDDVKLDLICNIQEMLNITSSLNIALLNSLDSGIYNLNKSSVEEFVKINEQLYYKLKDMLEKSNG